MNALNALECCDEGACNADCVGVATLFDVWGVQKPTNENSSGIPWSFAPSASVCAPLEQACGGYAAGAVPPFFAPGGPSYSVGYRDVYSLPTYEGNSVGLTFFREGFDDQGNASIVSGLDEEDDEVWGYAVSDLATGVTRLYEASASPWPSPDAGSLISSESFPVSLGVGRKAVCACTAPSYTSRTFRLRRFIDGSPNTVGVANVAGNPANTSGLFTLVAPAFNDTPYFLAYKRSTGEVARVNWKTGGSSDATFADSDPQIEKVVATLPAGTAAMFWAYHHYDGHDACLVGIDTVNFAVQGTHYIDSRAATPFQALDAADTTGNFFPTFLLIGPDHEIVTANNNRVRRLGTNGWVRTTTQTPTFPVYVEVSANCGWYHLRGWNENLSEASLLTGYYDAGAGGNVLHTGSGPSYYYAHDYFAESDDPATQVSSLSSQKTTGAASWMLSRDNTILQPTRLQAAAQGLPLSAGRAPMTHHLFSNPLVRGAMSDGTPIYRQEQSPGPFSPNSLTGVEGYRDWKMNAAISRRAAMAMYGYTLQGPDKAV